jgi:hypothetical protein
MLFSHLITLNKEISIEKDKSNEILFIKRNESMTSLTIDVSKNNINQLINKIFCYYSTLITFSRIVLLETTSNVTLICCTTCMCG